MNIKTFKQFDLDKIKGAVSRELEGGHPVEIAKGLRSIQTWAGEQAKKQDEKNDREGVPE